MRKKFPFQAESEGPLLLALIKSIPVLTTLSLCPLPDSTFLCVNENTKKASQKGPLFLLSEISACKVTVFYLIEIMGVSRKKGGPCTIFH